MRTVHITNDTLTFLEDGDVIATAETQMLFVQPTRGYLLEAVQVWTKLGGTRMWLNDVILLCQRRYEVSSKQYPGTIRPVEV